jgi:hypothetical protein
VTKRKGRPPIDLGEGIRSILEHTEPLGPESHSPITHYRQAVNANIALIDYIEHHLTERSRTGSLYLAIKAKYMKHLRRFVLANLIETFERFVKELAGVCIDQLAGLVTDDRFNEFSANGNEMIAHFEAGSIGKALCESDTWLSNEAINRRFRKLLASTDKEQWDEFLLPGKSQGRGDTKKVQEARAATLAILWQLRHNFTHNSGVLTGSDTMKLRALAKRSVEKARVLAPSEEDLRYVKRFLSETAEDINQRTGMRLTQLLTEIHAESALFVDPVTKAQELANLFRLPLSVAGNNASPVEL